MEENKICIICNHIVCDGCGDWCDNVSADYCCCDGTCIYSIEDLSYRDYQLICFALNNIDKIYHSKIDISKYNDSEYYIDYNNDNSKFEIKIKTT